MFCRDEDDSHTDYCFQPTTTGIDSITYPSQQTMILFLVLSSGLDVLAVASLGSWA